MNILPTSYDVFGVYSLDEGISDLSKEEYIHHCINECVSEALKPYKEMFNSNTFRFEEGEMELLYGPTGYIFGEEESTTPLNRFMACNSFITLRGTKYEQLLRPNHFIKPSSDDERDCFAPIGFELDKAENHDDANWDYYASMDKESYLRVINCYKEAAKDNNLNALWCLGCALNLWNDHFRELYDVLGLTYHYLSLAIQKGHITCIPSLCDRLQCDGVHKEAFMFTYIGAQKKEIYCMWNLAMYYLCGIIVPKSEDKAVDLLESILCVINQKDSDHAKFYSLHYDGIDKNDIIKLKEYTEHNLKIINSHSDSWRKYFDIEVCRKYRVVCDMLIKERCYDTSIAHDIYVSRVKELMNQELFINYL
jgi:hypothetical protein